MTDIVEWLGYHSESQVTGKLQLTNPDGPEAAAEITALRAEIERLRAAIASEREACAKIANEEIGSYLCPYGRDKPGDPTWHHTDADKCPVCGGDGESSRTTCHDTVQGRIAAAIRARGQT